MAPPSVFAGAIQTLLLPLAMTGIRSHLNGAQCCQVACGVQTQEYLLTQAMVVACRVCNILDVRSGKAVSQVTGGHASAVNSVAWALAASSASEADEPCGQTHACEHQMLSTSFDAAIYVHDIRQPNVPLLGLAGHTSLPKVKSMHQAAFSWGMILLRVPVDSLWEFSCALLDLNQLRRPVHVSFRSDHTCGSAGSTCGAIGQGL